MYVVMRSTYLIGIPAQKTVFFVLASFEDRHSGEEAADDAHGSDSAHESAESDIRGEPTAEEIAEGL